MKSKARVVLLVLIACLIVLDSGIVASIQSDRQCTEAEETALSDVIGEQRLFFTMSSQDENPQLELWYADHTGAHFSSVTLSEADRLVISPNGEYILVVLTSLASPGYYLTDFRLVSTDDFRIRHLNLSESTDNIRFMLPSMQWVDDETILLLSVEEDQLILAINALDGQVTFQEWGALPLYEGRIWPDLRSPGGNMLFSPNGEYVLYTVTEPLIAPPHEMAWRIVGREDGTVIEYVAGIGHTAAWLPDSSGLIFKNIVYGEEDSTWTYDLILVRLDGSQTVLFDGDAEFLERPLPDNHGLYVALTDTRFASDGSSNREYSLVILDVPSSTLTDYCQAALHIATGPWAPEGHLLPYRVRFPGLTEINLLDVGTNRMAPLLPYQPASDVEGSVFVRIVGWQDLSQ